jgi:hypothetical protein
VNALPGGEIVPALDRGLLDARRVQQRLLRPHPRASPTWSKICMLQSFHQSAEQFEILFNKAQVRRAARRAEGGHRPRACEACQRPTCRWKAIDRYSQDYIELQDQQGGQLLQDARRDAAARSWPPGTRSSTKKSAENPLFKKVRRQRSAPSPSAPVRWQNDYIVDFKMAYNHYFRRRPEEGLIAAAAPGRGHRRRRPGGRLFLTLPEERLRCKHSCLLAGRPAVARAGPGLRLADRRPHADDHAGRCSPATCSNAPHDWALDAADHDVRHAVHDGGRLHAGARTATCAATCSTASSSRARRPTLDLMLVRSCSSCPASVALTWAGWDYAARVAGRSASTRPSRPTPLPLYPFKFVIPIAGGMLLLQGLVEIVRCIQLHPRRRPGPRASRTSRRSTSTSSRQMVARQGRGHRRPLTGSWRRRGRHEVKIRKELVVRLHPDGAHHRRHGGDAADRRRQITDGHLGLMMLALVVVAIMLGFPTAFTLMGMGMIFTWLAYERDATARRWT